MGQKVSTSKAYQLLTEDLGIKPCRKEEANVAPNEVPEAGYLQKYLCLVPKEWLLGVCLSQDGSANSVSEVSPFSEAEQIEILQPSHVGHKDGWIRVKITVVEKPVQPFRIGRIQNSALSTASFFAVYDTLAKESRATKKKLFKQKLNDLNNLFKGSNPDDAADFVLYNEEDLPLLLDQFYGINFQYLDPLGKEIKDGIAELDSTTSFDYWANLHILPILAALHGTQAYFFVEPSPQTTFYDALSYNPKMFSHSNSNAMFTIYQLLQIIASYESKEITLSSSFSLKDLYITNNLWLLSSGLNFNCIAAPLEKERIADVLPYPQNWTESEVVHSLDTCDKDLSAYTDLWVTSKLSNFDYLLVLNKFAGRRPYDPHHHPVIPWITDFSAKNGGFRELSKSKFRLKKGDSMLNAMYKADVMSNQDKRNILKSTAPHHLTDVLSDLSYYLYFARRAPKKLLCMHVRPRWVPHEYPQTLSKLYDQAAEECIPEFYCDPSIFKSIHPDMCDLGLPTWTDTPEEFISYHKELLESDYISRHLHSWIDLVFGYKLLGEDAIKSKNVYLSMVTDEQQVSNHGVVPLFSKPHPHKLNSRINFFSVEEYEQADGLILKKAEGKGIEEVSSFGSTYQLVSYDQGVNEADPHDANKSGSSDNSTSQNGSTKSGEQEVINLSKKENFLYEMEVVESLLKFQISLGNLKGDRAGDYLFGMPVVKNKKQVPSAVKNLSSGLQLLVCLTIELFLHDKVRHRILDTNLDERTTQNLKVLKSNRKTLPRWLVNLLSNLSGVIGPDATLSRNRELPKNINPSSLLNPTFNMLNFPKYFPVLHKFLASLYAMDGFFSSDLSKQWIQRSTNSPNPEKIILAAETLPRLLEELDPEGIELLFTFLMPFFESLDTKIVSLLHLLYPMGRTVGQQKSVETFLKLVVKTYDIVDVDDAEQTQIFTQSYVSKLITVFGVEIFIEYILPFLLDGLIGDVFSTSTMLDRSANFQTLSRPDTFSSKRRNDEEYSDTSSGSENNSSVSENENLFNDAGSIEQDIIVSVEPTSGQSDMEIAGDKPDGPCDDTVVADRDSLNILVEQDVSTDTDSSSKVSDPEQSKSTTVSEESNIESVSSAATSPRQDTNAEMQIELTEATTEEHDVTDFSSKKSKGEGSPESSDHDTNDVDRDTTGLDWTDTENKQEKVKRLRSVSESIDESNDPGLLGVDYPFSKERADSEASPFTLILPTPDDELEAAGSHEVVSSTLDDVENIPYEESKYGSSFKRMFSESEASVKPLSVSQLCYESVYWLIPWLGPLLTSEHIVKRLLKKLPRLFVVQKGDFSDSEDDIRQSKAEIKDQVLDCLLEIAQVYGEAVVLMHYVPFAVTVVNNAATAKIISATLEGQLIASFTLLHRCFMILTVETLMAEIEPLSDKVFQPLLRILSTLRTFQNGHHARTILARLFVDTMGVFSRKLGREFAQDALMSLLQQFFSCFDGIYIQRRSASGYSFVVRKFSMLSETQRNQEEWAKNSCDEGWHSQHSGTTAPYYDDYSIEDIIDSFSNQTANAHEGEETQESNARDPDTKSVGSAEEIREGKFTEEQEHAQNRQSYDDFYETFSTSLAYYSYVLFCRTLGEQYMEKTLYNSELIWQLCTNHDDRLTLASCPVSRVLEDTTDTGALSDSNVLEKPKHSPAKKGGLKRGHSNSKFGSRFMGSDAAPAESFRSTWQHIVGSWLELWNDRQRGAQMESFDFHDRRLQTYAGHSAAVKDIHVPENEHYFLSASRDKTVKFWLLKNHGNGTAQIGNTGFYDQHTKPVFAVQSINTKRLAVSCDGTVHVWDPITGAAVSKFEPPKGVSVVAIRTLPSPHSAVVLATSDGLARLYDVRQKMPFGEWKTSPVSMGGSVRSMAVPYDSSWLAVGFSTGMVSVLDMRTGIMRNQWRAHDTEVLQLLPFENHNFLSASIDSKVKMWADDGTLTAKLRPPQDTILSVTLCKGKCIWGSSNKVGVYHSLETGAESLSRKISPDIFKGTISKVAVLPINQLFLIGSESGNVMLYH